MIGQDYPDNNPDLLEDMRNGAWLDAQEFPPLSYAVSGVIPEGMTLFCGPPKVGKSWLLLGVALAVASGGRALGTLPVQRRPVLLFALEDGDRRLQSRCRTLIPGEAIPPGLDYMTRVRPNVVLATASAWMQLHDGQRPVIILDTLGKVAPPAGPGESAYARDYRIGGDWKALADAYPGSSVVVNHHIRKAASDDFVDSVSGTHGLAGVADTIIILRRARHELAGLLTVTGRDVAEEEYGLQFSNGGVWSLDGATLDDAMKAAEVRRATAGVADRMGEVIKCVVTEGKPVRAQQIADVLGMSKDDAGKYLRRAAEAGRIARHSRGLFAPLSEASEVSENVIPFGRFGHSTHNGHTPTRGECARCHVPDARLINGWCEPCSYPTEPPPGYEDDE